MSEKPKPLPQGPEIPKGDATLNKFEGQEYMSALRIAGTPAKAAYLISLMSLKTSGEIGIRYLCHFREHPLFRWRQEGNIWKVFDKGGDKEELVAEFRSFSPGEFMITFYDNGKPALEMGYSDYKLVLRKVYHEGKLMNEQTDRRKFEWGKDGETIHRVVKYNEMGAPVEIIDRNGAKIDLSLNVFDSDFQKVKEVYPTVSEDEFISLLATWHRTPESLERFIEMKMLYVFDSPVKGVRGRHIHGRLFNSGEYHQTPVETIDRYEFGDNKYVGDCDDYAHLLKAILKKQGHDAMVVYVPGHATCVWTVKSGDEYTAYDLGTFELKSATSKYKFHAVHDVLQRYVSESDSIRKGSVYVSKADYDQLREWYPDAAIPRITAGNMGYFVSIYWGLKVGRLELIDVVDHGDSHASYKWGTARETSTLPDSDEKK